MESKVKGLLLGTIVLFASAAVLAQSAPTLMSYQGRLLDSSGIPVSGSTVEMGFAIYDSDFQVSSVSGESIYLWEDFPSSLDYRNVVEGSEVVTSTAGSTVETYTRDVDYTMDYPAGMISRIPTGSIPNSAWVDVDYDYQDGGFLWWGETQSVEVSNGIYSVMLGEGATLNPWIFEGSSVRWLEISVRGDTLTPRQRMGVVPYAMQCQYLGGLDSTEYALSSHGHSFSSMTGSISDIQVPNDITIDYAMSAATATSADNCSQLGGQTPGDYVLAAGDTIVGDLQVNGAFTMPGRFYAQGTQYGVQVPSSASFPTGAEFHGEQVGVSGYSANSPSGANNGRLGGTNYGIYGWAGDSSATADQAAAYLYSITKGSATGVYTQAVAAGSTLSTALTAKASTNSTADTKGAYIESASNFGTATGVDIYAAAGSSDPAKALVVLSNNFGSGPETAGKFTTSANGTGSKTGIHVQANGNGAGSVTGVEIDNSNAPGPSTGLSIDGMQETMKAIKVHRGYVELGWDTPNYADDTGDLFVSRDLEVGGAVYFQDTQTRYLSIHSLMPVGSPVFGDWINADGYLMCPDGQSCYGAVDIHLPQDAAVTAVRVYGFFGGTSHNAEVALRRSGVASTATDTMADMTLTTSDMNETDTSILFPTIDNYSNTYTLRVYETSTSRSGYEVRIHGLQIEYTVEKYD